MNFILNSDSYKMSHYMFYPEGTEHVYSYMESRGGRYPSTLFFGAQGFIEQYLTKPITKGDISEAEDFSNEHFGSERMFNRAGWNHILRKHGGYMPVLIKAIPEGTLLPTHTSMMTVENTDPEVPFITSYIETQALRLWYPITVATRGYYMKQKIRPYFEETSDSMNMDFAILDFSARGCTSYESSQLAGAAHLVNFSGSDAMAGINYVKKYYGGEILGYSVPATEHSIMCSYESEIESFEYIINQVPNGSIISVVSDTWDIYAATDKWVTLKDKLTEKNLTLVVRPDSGDIREVMSAVLGKLAAGFGTTVNSKGYRILNGVKVLWADGMDENTIITPYQVAKELGISADSVMAGSGGGLAQADLDRDTSKFAFKASNIVVNGKSRAIAKDPITDPGKMSKRGRMLTIIGQDGYETITSGDSLSNYFIHEDEDVLQPIYHNGAVMNTTTMLEIRNRIIKN